MPDQDVAWNAAPASPEGSWRRFSATLPMRASLTAVGVVWLLGCVWSFQEQSAFATSKGFAFPHLLPLVIDGFAVSMAGVSWAASLDARPAIPARLATVVAVGASSASNGVWAYLRTHHDLVTVALGVAVPVAANLAFEVLLAELRRQVQRRRGLPPPVAVPYPRLIRLLLAPWQTFRAWRNLVLEITSMDHAVSRPTPEVLHASAEVSQLAPEVSQHPAQAPLPRLQAPTIARTVPESHAIEHAVIERNVAEATVLTSDTSSPIAPSTSPAPIFTARVSAPYADAPVTQAQPERRLSPAAPPPPARHDTAPIRVRADSDQRQLPEPPNPARSTTERAVTEPSAVRRSSQPAPTQPRPIRQPAATAPKPVTSNSDADSNADTGSRPSTNGVRRSSDPRVEQLVELMTNSDNGAEELTGESVGRLFGVSERSGRRLLGQARELVSQRAKAESEPDAELSVIGGR
jgi:Protein of unknown function (DUF2637)